MRTLASLGLMVAVLGLDTIAVAAHPEGGKHYRDEVSTPAKKPQELRFIKAFVCGKSLPNAPFMDDSFAYEGKRFTYPSSNRNVWEVTCQSQVNLPSPSNVSYDYVRVELKVGADTKNLKTFHSYLVDAQSNTDVQKISIPPQLISQINKDNGLVFVLRATPVKLENVDTDRGRGDFVETNFGEKEFPAETQTIPVHLWSAE